MSHNPRIQEINEELNKLSLRRNVVEKRIEFRLQTMDKFNELHEQSKRRLYEQTWKQNEEARQRNHNLLRQIGAVNGSLQARPAVQGKSSAAVQLEHAKKSYLSFSSKLYPTWKEQTTIKKLSLLNKIQAEKEEAEKRRLKSLHHLKHEHDIRAAVEEERRQLLLALSLEQRDQLEASAKLHLLKDRGKAVESELQSQFQAFGDQYERYLAEASTRSLQEAHNLLTPLFSIPNDSLESSSEIIDPRRPGLQGRLDSTRISGKYNQNISRHSKAPSQRRYQEEQEKDKESNYQQEYDDSFDNNFQQENQSQKSRNIPTSNISFNQDFNQSSSYPNSFESESKISRNTTYEHVNEKISPYETYPPNPQIMIEPDKQSAALPPKPPLRKQNSSFTQNDDSINFSIPSPPPLQPPSPSIISSSSPAVNNLSVSTNNNNNNISSSNLPQESTTTLQKLVVNDPSPKSSNSQNLTKLSENTSPKSNPQYTSTISVSEKENKKKIDESIEHSTSIAKNINSTKIEENGIENSNINSNNNTNNNTNDNNIAKVNNNNNNNNSDIEKNKNDRNNQNSHNFNTPPIVSNDEKKDFDNKNDNKNVKDNNDVDNDSQNNNNNNNVNDNDGDNDDDDVDIDTITVTDSLAPRDISIILHSVCTYIEKLEEPLIVKKSYYNATIKSPQITSKKIHKVLDLITLNEIEALEDKSNPISPEVFTWIVLKIAEEKGSYLLPSEILNGVVSVDKLTKSHKKLGGGRTEIWTNFMSHFRKLTELKRITQEEISKFVTTSFIVHMDDADRTRNERKVMKLVQLSILPPEKETHSRPPTPQRKFGPPPDLSSTPPGTPNYSERPNSAGSVTSISAPPSPLLSFTAPPQSNKFSQRALEKTDITQFSGISNQFLPTNARQSTDSNLGIAAKRPSYEGNLSSSSNNSASLANKILKAGTAFKHDDDEIEDDDEMLTPHKTNPVVLKDLSSAADDEFDF